MQFLPDGEPAPLFCDLFDKTTNTLYESKSTVTRPATRMGIGQLADYCRVVDPVPTKSVCCPSDRAMTSSTSQRARTSPCSGQRRTATGEGALRKETILLLS